MAASMQPQGSLHEELTTDLEQDAPEIRAGGQKLVLKTKEAVRKGRQLNDFPRAIVETI